LENLAYLALRRKHPEIYYYKGKKECDFLVKEGKKITQAIQVCFSLDEDNQERETQGLIEALDKFNLPEGLILTHDQEDEITIKNKKIRIMPSWKWMTKDD
jgi:predicted AAA+ superfamily ATPase